MSITVLKHLSVAFSLGLVAAWAGVASAERVPDAKAQIVPPTPQWQAAVEEAAPAKPTVAAARRRVLVFARFTGYDHKVIPHVNRVFEILGRKSARWAPRSAWTSRR